MKYVFKFLLLVVGIGCFGTINALPVNFGSNTVLKNTSKATKSYVYKVKGRKYTVLSRKQAQYFSQKGIASFYGGKFEGRKTASGAIFYGSKFTAAHKTLPIPSYVLVTNLYNQKQIVVLINDRGPFVSGRIIDLSTSAAKALGINRSQGIARVTVDMINVGDNGKMSGPGYNKIKHKL